MSTKALKTQLLAAIAMVLVASIALGSSTYAWFASNSKVTADGLQVSAKSDNTYLLISNTSSETTAAAVQSSGKTAVTETKAGAAVAVKPTALITKATSVAVHKDSISDYADPASWYQASAADVKASAVKEDTEKVLTTKDGYIVEYSYNLCLAEGSTVANNLKATCTFTKAATAGGNATTMNPVRVLLVCGTNTEEFKASDAAAASGIAGTVTLADTVNDTTLTNVKVYVYYDGNDTAVFTNNSANLEGASISLSFGVDE